MTKKKISTAARITAQVAWMDSCGGNLPGYVAHYGSVNDPDHYGDGGEAIFTADNNELHRLCIRYNAER